MSLRQRTLLIVSTSLLGVILLVFIAAQAVLLNGYRTLEKQNVQDNLEGLRYLLNSEANLFVEEMRDHTQSSEAANFIRGELESYPQDILTEEFFRTHQISQIYVLNADHELIYSDGLAETLLPGLETSLAESDALMQFTHPADYQAGYVEANEDIFLITSQPIVDPGLPDSILGTMIWVRRFDPQELDTFSSSIDANIYWIIESDDSSDIRSEFDREHAIVEDLATEHLTGYIQAPTLMDRPPLILALEQERSVYYNSQQRFLLLGIVIVFIGIAFGLVTSFLLERMGTARFSSIHTDLQQILQTRAYHKRLDKSGSDYLAELTGSINQLLGLYQQSHDEQQKHTLEREELLQNLPIALIRLDQKGIWQSGSGATLEALGLSTEQAAGKSLDDLFPLANGLKRVVDQALHGEIVNQTMTLSPRITVELWLAPQRDRGEITGLIALLLNRSEVAQLEHDLAQAREAAEAAYNAKATFLANMSHELRTPLNAIIGFTGIMMMSRDPGDKDLYRMERIRANGERLLELIDDILDLSRIEAGRMILIPIEINLRETVSILTHRYERDASEKGIQFSMKIGPDVPNLLLVDQDALEKIIRNLLSNAVKFTEEGEICLELDVEGRDLVITVSDTGIGIPPHMHEIIFESFRQVDPSATRAYGGTGLGLSLVHNLCLAMGGKIRLESATEQGTTFTVTLPLIAQESRV